MTVTLLMLLYLNQQHRTQIPFRLVGKQANNSTRQACAIVCLSLCSCSSQWLPQSHYKSTLNSITLWLHWWQCVCVISLVRPINGPPIRVCVSRVCESVGQVQHIHLLVSNGAQLIIHVFLKDQVTGRTGQCPLTCAWQTERQTHRERDREIKTSHWVREQAKPTINNRINSLNHINVTQLTEPIKIEVLVDNDI